MGWQDDELRNQMLPTDLSERLTAMRARAEAVEKECSRWQLRFDLYEAALRRAIDEWRRVTGKHDVMPDTTHLMLWLLDRCNVDHRAKWLPSDNDRITFLQNELNGASSKQCAAISIRDKRIVALEAERDELEAAITDISGMFLGENEDLDDVNLYQRIFETLKAHQED